MLDQWECDDGTGTGTKILFSDHPLCRHLDPIRAGPDMSETISPSVGDWLGTFHLVL